MDRFLPSPTARILLALLAILALAPLVFPSTFYYRIFTLISINAIVVIGLVILLGYAGQISLGHAGFVGLGAYANAIGPTHLGLPPLLALVLGAALSAALAWLVGRPILKLRGLYLAVVTLGFGILVQMVLVNESWLTGGPDGMAVEDLGLVSLVKALGLKMKTAQVWYVFSGLMLLLAAWVALNLRDSPTGRALRSLHDSEVAARTVGINVARYKLIAFVLSAVFASVGGSLLALFNRFVTPDVAGFIHSVELVTMSVLGGAASVLGGIAGAALLTTLPQALTVFHDFETVILGLIMMGVAIFMPDGLLPNLANRAKRTRRTNR
ncbi:MAG: branched-chain amino acid ABC transporter permease [Rhodospirillum sp.]|nr:branched-chain amino acid ABC transporter permease [Rhodospirillum sp.]MCF8489185.1 branched-chain amino acid ABC transporter permease [Rhodospirillum sp.]MCF8501337.1 branched-chain amino acid ABC transporter permease [Rhodospirillum sp.]